MDERLHSAVSGKATFPVGLVRAAQYVRMSTEHQQYSTDNQARAIRDYAERRGIAIVRTYADEGKSGLRLTGRDALKQLIQDVESGDADFTTILVYDVSRWGRFQDADESAYYEYICKREGISVQYCAEQFENDGSPVSTIVKGVKRAMAGEYSRELSAKVFAGQCRLIELGYRQGGPPGYGLRRRLIDQSKIAKGELARGEQKSIQTDRVILVPGPREVTGELMAARGLVDVLIPRGGAGLIDTVVRNSQVPVIETGVGNCHIFVDADADEHMALAVVINAKTQRPSVCNAAETLLVHADIADSFVPKVLDALAEHGVTVHGDPRVAAYGEIVPAEERDFAEEYLSLDIAVAIMDSLDDALAHIRRYSTGHSETIITESQRSVARFTAEVDAAAVLVNASSRFVDGGEFGFGAEIGISTQKLHARGPMGLPEMTSTKYVIIGSGQVRA